MKKVVKQGARPCFPLQCGHGNLWCAHSDGVAAQLEFELNVAPSCNIARVARSHVFTRTRHALLLHADLALQSKVRVCSDV
jgi:hypothetical protein